MAYYWDTSADEYLPPNPEDNDCFTSHEASHPSSPRNMEKKFDSASPENGSEPRKRTKPNPADSITPSDLAFPHRPISHPISSSVSAQARTQPPNLPPGHPALNKQSTTLSRVPEGTYRGTRIGNGACMPEQHRYETVRAFVEPIAWAFGFTISVHRKPSVLGIKNLRIPIKSSPCIWRPPKEREKARMGWLVGPVLGISCRGETEFADDRADSVLDALKEIGALLVLAQERARQGKSEVKPGEGKWWTTVPRWGGGVGGEPVVTDASPPVAIRPEADATEKLINDSDAKAYLEGRIRQGSRNHGNARRKVTAAEGWKILRPGAGYWNPRIDYTAIGKPADSSFDEV